jgi:hypothetical protein
MMLLTDDSDSTSSSMMSSTHLWWEGAAFMLHHSCTCNNRLLITPCECYFIARYQITSYADSSEASRPSLPTIWRTKQTKMQSSWRSAIILLDYNLSVL